MWPLSPRTVCQPEVRVMKGSTLRQELPGAHLLPAEGAGGSRGCSAVPAAREVGDAGEHHDAADATGRLAWPAQLPSLLHLLLLRGGHSRGLCPRRVPEALEVLGMAYPGVRAPGPRLPSGSPRGDVAVPGLVPASTLLPVRCSLPAAGAWAASPLGRPGAPGCCAHRHYCHVTGEGGVGLSSVKSHFPHWCLPREMSGRWLRPPCLRRSETQAEGVALISGVRWHLAVPSLASAQLQAWPAGGFSAGFR